MSLSMGALMKAATWFLSLISQETARKPRCDISTRWAAGTREPEIATSRHIRHGGPLPQP
jgi:hypothetical protein